MYHREQLLPVMAAGLTLVVSPFWTALAGVIHYCYRLGQKGGVGCRFDSVCGAAAFVVHCSGTTATFSLDTDFIIRLQLLLTSKGMSIL